MLLTARQNWRIGYMVEAIPTAVQGVAAATAAGTEATSASEVTPSVDSMLAVGVDVADSAISIGDQKTRICMGLHILITKLEIVLGLHSNNNIL